MIESAPKKSLGQHWLYDIETLHIMVDIADVKRGDTVLEIGPGLGTLTEVLLAHGTKVVAVEYDQDLYKNLVAESKMLFSEDAKRLKLVQSDILRFDLGTLPADYKVVANIPYYLTSKLIRVLSETSNPPQSVTLLIQKEVAQRLAAGPGGMSLLTVSAGMYFEPNLGPVVPAALFTPSPKVDSQIVHMRRRNNPLFGHRDSKQLFSLIKAGFSNRRKTLLNSLSAGLHISKEETVRLLEKAGIDPKCRPQELSLEQWLKVMDALTS